MTRELIPVKQIMDIRQVNILLHMPKSCKSIEIISTSLNITTQYHIFVTGRDSIRIVVENVQISEQCEDNPHFANCKLIVRAQYCTNKYYAKFCCRSCTMAGQLRGGRGGRG